jgi:outer membrane protein
MIKMKLVQLVVVKGMILFFVVATQAQQKLAHLNSAEIMAVMPELKTANVALESFQRVKKAEIDKMVSEFQVKLKTAQEKQKTLSEANKGVLGKELRTMDAELRDMDKRIEYAQKKAEVEFQAKTEELINPIRLKVGNVIKIVVKEKGVTYVLDTGNEGLLYWEGGEGITEVIKNKLGIVSSPKK